MNEALFRQFRDLVLNSSSATDDPGEALVAADFFLEHGQDRLAASALNRAFGLDPQNETVSRLRTDLLDQLAVEEHGLRFRYIPAGTFRMGSDAGDPDERPVHDVTLDDYWVTDIPMTWAAYCELMQFSAPPQGYPEDSSDDESERMQLFHLAQSNKIRLQYCETETSAAVDWHAHAPDAEWRQGGQTVTGAEIFGRVPRNNPKRPFEYNIKPMVCVSWQEAEELCERITTSAIAYHLPSEAQWEKAARGGLISCRYSWGNEPPDHDLCDCERFGDWAVRPPMLFPPNGYGLHGMCGGVWEWTLDDYDALAYQPPGSDGPASDTRTQRTGLLQRLFNFVTFQGGRNEAERTLRGGSWADCPDAATVSFRMSRSSCSWREEEWSDAMTPTIGFRICRQEVPD